MLAFRCFWNPFLTGRDGDSPAVDFTVQKSAEAASGGRCKIAVRRCVERVLYDEAVTTVALQRMLLVIVPPHEDRTYSFKMLLQALGCALQATIDRSQTTVKYKARF